MKTFANIVLIGLIVLHTQRQGFFTTKYMEVYVSSEYIELIVPHEDGIGAHSEVTLKNRSGYMFVSETPKEIMKLIEGDKK